MSETEVLMVKARRFLRDAGLLMEDGGYDTVASRCYYAMFSAARAMLLTRGLEPYTHKGVISLFTDRFIKSRQFESVHAKSLRWAYDLRRRGDYGIEVSVCHDEAELAIVRARDFLEAAETWLVKAKPSSQGAHR